MHLNDLTESDFDPLSEVTHRLREGKLTAHAVFVGVRGPERFTHRDFPIPATAALLAKLNVAVSNQALVARQGQGHKPRVIRMHAYVRSRTTRKLNEDTDTIVAFDVDPATGELALTSHVPACGSPVCMVFA